MGKRDRQEKIAFKLRELSEKMQQEDDGFKVYLKEYKSQDAFIWSSHILHYISDSLGLSITLNTCVDVLEEIYSNENIIVEDINFDTIRNIFILLYV